jgi:hypothetical protein
MATFLDRIFARSGTAGFCVHQQIARRGFSAMVVVNLERAWYQPWIDH